MKRLLSLLAFCCLAFAACDNEKPSVDIIKLSQQVIEVDFEPNTYAVFVTSPYSWDAVAKNDWIIINTISGIAGTRELQFTVERNEQLNIREGTIVIKNKDAGLYTELSVIQKIFDPILNVENKPVLEFSCAGGEQPILVESNFEYNIISDAEWLTFHKTSTGLVVTASSNLKSSRNANISIFGAKYNIGCSVISVIQDKFEPNAVDLGLSVKWASCNLGAAYHCEYGDYFAWGEIGVKDYCCLENYVYWTDINGDGHQDKNEYTPLSDIACNPQYDAATTNWGENWRMPTMSEQQELVNACNWEWVSDGMRVTGPNGNSIFLPASGYNYVYDHDQGNIGIYWGSTPNTDDNEQASVIYFSRDFCRVQWDNRYCGFMIRPVLD